MKILKLTAIIIAITTLSSPVFAQANHSHSMKHDMEMMSAKSSPNAASKPFDLRYIDTMSAHHKGAIDMAEMVGDRSSRAELKAMAKTIIEDQQQEIAEFQSWKHMWYAGNGDAVDMKMHGMMGSMKGMSMETLASSTGPEFDAMFLNMMIKHHKGAIEMSQIALKKAKHPEVKEKAKQIIAAQRKENQQMIQWQKEWNLAAK